MIDEMNCTNCNWKLITINHSSDDPPVKGNITACSFCLQPYQHNGTRWIPFTKEQYEAATPAVKDQIQLTWDEIGKFKQGMIDKGLIR